MIGVREIFDHVRLEPQGPALWAQRIDDRGPGVYVISVDIEPETLADKLEMGRLGLSDSFNWVVGENIVYIGRTQASLRRRLDQFYRHTYGRSSPHRGGQELLRLAVPRHVYWASTQRPVEAEHRMIEKFCEVTGKRPYANKARGWFRKLAESEFV